jgi:predicted transcriptional regulator
LRGDILSDKAKPKRLQIADIDTGEVQYAVVPLRKKHITGGFFLAMQEAFIWLAKSNLPHEQLRVLHYLFGKLDFENWLRVSQAEISKELEMKRSNISRAIKALVDRGILHKGPKVGTSWTYRLDPSFGYKGRGKNLKKLEQTIQKTKEKGWRVIEGGAQEND